MTAVFIDLRSRTKSDGYLLFQDRANSLQHSEGEFQLSRVKESFSVNYSPNACANTRFHGVQPYDHTKEAAKDSSAQK